MLKLVPSAALLSLCIIGCGGGSGDAQGTETSTSALGAGHEVEAGHHRRETVSVEWNEATLAAIRGSGFGPSIAARAIAEVHTAAYDAWTAYSDHATPTQPSVTRQPAQARTSDNKRVAMSQAAYRVLVDLFPADQADFAARLQAAGGNEGDVTAMGSSPVAIGNAAAAAILAARQFDASNQNGDINPGAYSDYTGYAPVNTPTAVNDPSRWQPLVVGGQTQTFLTPQWQNVIPFALTSPDELRAAPPAAFGSAGYASDAEELLDLSARLDGRRKVIAEYWTDGPGTSTAAGHWTRLAQIVSSRDRHSIDEDAKMFFALGNALLDASIAAWESKRFYDYVRPITAIHQLYAGKTVTAWGGPGKGTQKIDGAKWQPYEPANEVTPASPGYVAEESAFAFAAAKVLELATGSDAFGGDFVAEEGSSRIEPNHTPRRDVRLCWRTYERAARQAGFATRLRGVSFAAGDLAGRKLGTQVGAQAWTAASALFHDVAPTCAHVGRADCDGDDADDAR